MSKWTEHPVNVTNIRLKYRIIAEYEVAKALRERAYNMLELRSKAEGYEASDEEILKAHLEADHVLSGIVMVVEECL